MRNEGPPDLPEEIEEFGLDVNTENVLHLSAAESEAMLRHAFDAAVYDLRKDRQAADPALASVPLRDVPVDASHMAQLRKLLRGVITAVTEDSENNERLIEAFWEGVRPLIGKTHFPWDQIAYEIQALEKLSFHAAPDASTKDVRGIQRNNTLAVTAIVRNEQEGTTYLRVINPLNILEEVWVNVGANGEHARRIPSVGDLLSNADTLRGHLSSLQAHNVATHHPDIVQRTLPNRLVDHERLLATLEAPAEGSVEADMARILFGASSHPPVFIDIGPGIGNNDAEKEGVVNAGMPAITSAEMASSFEDMQVVIVDLPEAVDRFRTIPALEQGRTQLLAHQNVHVVAGNGLLSLREQLDSKETNPFPDRPRPDIAPGTPIIIRTANAIDVYCKWDEANDGSPSVREALRRMAEDFLAHPVLLLFHRSIVLKPAGSAAFSLVGQVSGYGFNAVTRTPGHSGVPAYTLDPAVIAGVLEGAPLGRLPLAA